WPHQLLLSKAVFLEKPETKTAKFGDPLAYRVLQILPTLYRRWGMVRLYHLRSWCEEWGLGAMYAGLPYRGAEQAIWHLALDIEEALLSGEEVSLFSIDLFKCFDQINRPLLYRLLSLAGVPEGVVRAYRCFQERVMVYNHLASGLGAPHRRARGIPQGCPLSMLFTALLLRPWIIEMQAGGAIPRVLADDL
ncbi:MAG: hypothetical protein GY721_10250, partial [Deltaproteobacteria bacterium]|nr:hypothetical protein [Deltaproteobacteria bacterium]